MTASSHATRPTRTDAARRHSGNESAGETRISGTGINDVGPRLGIRTTAALASGGKGLPEGFRKDMETRFGTDFASVRLESQAELGAAAVTESEQITLDPIAAQAAPPLVRRIVAHELAHVVQQRRGGAERPTLDGSGPLEAGARAASDAVMSGTGPVAVSGASATGPAAFSFKELASSAAELYDEQSSRASNALGTAVDEYVPDSVKETVADVSEGIDSARSTVDSLVDDYVPAEVQDLASEFELLDPAAPMKAAVKKYAPDVKKGFVDLVKDYEDSDAPATATNPIMGPVVDLLDTVTDGEASQLYRETQGGAAIALYSMVEGVALAAADPEQTAKGLMKMADTVGPVHLSDFENTAGLVADLASDDMSFGEAFESYGAAQQSATQQRNEDMRNMGKALAENYVQAGEEGRWGQFPGMLAVDIGSMIYGGPATKSGAAAKASKTAGTFGKFKSFLGFSDDVARTGKVLDDAGALGKTDDIGNVGKNSAKLDKAPGAGKQDAVSDAGKLNEADVISINKAFLDSLPQVLDDTGELIMGMLDEFQPKMAANGGGIPGPRPRPLRAAGGGGGGTRKPKVSAANDTVQAPAPKPRAGRPKPTTKPEKAPTDKGKDFTPDKTVEVETRLPEGTDAAKNAAALGITPKQYANAQKMLGRPLSEVFSGAWDRALGRSGAAQKKMAEVNKLLEKAKQLRAQGKTAAAEKAAKKAQKLAKGAYEGVQPKFWPEVYKDPKNIKTLEEAGFTIEKTVDKAGKAVPKRKAPYMKDLKGKRQKITLEHTERKVDVPERAVDPTGLVLSLSRENSVYLEAIRRIMRERMSELGMLRFTDWPSNK